MSRRTPRPGMTRPVARPRHRRAGRLARAARHRRQRGAAGDHRPLPAGARRRAVARHLLRAGLRLADAGVRQAGRPVRPSPDLPHRPGDLRRRLRRLRRRAGLAALPVGARGPGRRHGAGAFLHAGARHLAVPRERAHARARGLRRGDVARRRRSVRSWAACWSSCGAGPRSTGCACRSRWSRLPCRACCRRPSPTRGRSMRVGAVLLAVCMSALLLSLVLSQRREVPGLWALGLFAAALVVAWRLRAPRQARARADHPARRCSPIPPSPCPTS